MKFLPREAWRYAVLLIVLLAIASVTVREILGFLRHHIASQHFQVAAILIASLTMGFMLIAGAFGLWAIRFSAEAESRRRIGLLVGGMGYLSDGLVAIDQRGRVTASNPAAQRLLASDLGNEPALGRIFPNLSQAEIARLLDRRGPSEIECSIVRNDASRVFRLRSQPSAGFLLISDITSATAQIAHNRQLARLQLIGQIARGVAHDFNNLLCVISGHASVLSHLPPGSLEMRCSIDQILKATERGVSLADHLLDLAQPSVTPPFTDVAHEFVHLAVRTLSDSLPDRWKIAASIEPISTVALTGLQIEQIVLNLGYLCADALPEPGNISITLTRPRPDRPFNVGNQFAGVMILTATPATGSSAPQETSEAQDVARESGVILSVLRSMIQEAHGSLDSTKSPEGLPFYRVALPFGNLPLVPGNSKQAILDVAPYVARWSVLVAVPAGHQGAQIEKRLSELSVRVERADNAVSALARIGRAPPLDGVIVAKNLLRNESESLLRAMVKLCPSAGIVALSATPQNERSALAFDIVFAGLNADPNSILLALVEAKAAAGRRRPPNPDISHGSVKYPG
ncbi:MAG: hypothetical protein QME60_06645 [Verrucomicrobiota bacterium]|nr:hypothetical protein [Verrucomicrobiota bacterium]